MQIFGRRAFLGGPDHLGHVDRPILINADAVRREEIAGLPAFGSPEVFLFNSRGVKNTDPRPRSVAVRGDQDVIHVQPVAEFGYVNLALMDANGGGPINVGPNRFEIAIDIEHLDSLIFAVRHIDVVTVINGYAMRQIELAGASSRLAPGFYELAVG